MTDVNGALSGPIKLRVSLIYPEIAVFQIGLFVAMIWRGLDYVTPPDEKPGALSVVEQALPFHAWGAALLGAGAVGLLGLVWARWPITALAHGGAVALYAAFAVGSLLSILERIETAPPLLVTATLVLVFAAVVIVVALVEWRAKAWRSAAWVLLAATVTGCIIALAASTGVYGWRTATDWLFVLAVAHAVMADASIDAWRDLNQHVVEEANHADPAP
ncbi:hypothetical protein [Tsukamurella sp. 1534]|uniref:hypothetical protein n=1 Tax=Tsukamurella sp. 1534 TaxID=1151061 RepID=UPI0011D28E54|nr:hypothetical protein [Tsukamurella sp. 1534]